MNLETSVLKILDGNGTLDKKRHLPFRRMTSSERIEEQVRPIFWAIKPKSYVAQTQDWDDFPNGRWGNSASPSFELKMDEGFISFSRKQSVDNDGRRALWGQEVLNVAAIVSVFTQFVSRTLKKFPFSEGAMTSESDLVKDTLISLN